jgi:cation diffusion facilitator family transporter
MTCPSIGASARVVLTALAGNVGVALAKFVAFAFTGSSAMLTEAVHSMVDTTDQMLLLIGQKRAARPPDEAHPLGHGMEAYFWTFIVALMVFGAGGAASIWQGVHKIAHPEPLTRPWISFLVLGASAVFEAISFRSAYLEYRRIVRGLDVPLWRFLQLSKDPSVFATLLEDGAALLGLAIAALGITGAVLGLAWADGAASIAIGLLLAAVALFLANETRSLIAGEAAPPNVLRRVRDLLGEDERVEQLEELLSLQLGPWSMLFAARLRFRQGMAPEDVLRTAAALGEQVKAVDPRISRVFLSPAG